MTQPSENDIRTEVEWNQELLDSALEGLEDTPEEDRSYFRLARVTRALGVYSLLLEEGEPLERFAESTEWFCKRWDQLRGEINEPQMVMWTLFTAVLSRDDTLINQVGRKVRSNGVEYQDPEYYTHLDDCLANLLAGNDEAAVEAADTLISLEPNAPKRVGSYPGLGGACRAIVDGDHAALDTALASTLDRHENLKQDRADISDQIVICIPATVFLLIAHDRGLAVEETDIFQSEYIPNALFE